MTIVKPMRLGLISRARQEPPKVYFFVTALGYFDLLDPSDFDLDTRMWPMVAAALGGSPLDTGMPKPRGEVLVIGEAAAPAGRPVTQMSVEFAVGPVRKRLAIFGDRRWELSRDGAVFTRPLPFERMPLVWERAFGGPGFADNAVGTGYGARATLEEGRPVRLPNIENAAELVLDVDQTPKPAGCAPLDLMSPVRQRYAGTYDETWLRRHHPGHAVDFDWSFYNAAPEDQWAPGFFGGDERIRLAGMHPDHPVIQSRLPGMRVRAFLNLQAAGGRRLVEVDMRCETVVLFPTPLKGVVIYRGGREVADIDGKDVVDTLLAYERLEDAPRPVEHYSRTLRERTDPETAGLSFFDEKPLRPDIPEAERAEREAAREALAAEREAKWDKRIAAALAKAYRAAGAMPPPPDAIPKTELPVALPVITPGDIERMDVDMAGLARAIGELRAYGEQQIALAQQRAATVLGQVASLAESPGGRVLDPAALARMREAAAQLPLPPENAPPVLPAGMPSLEGLRQDLPAGPQEVADPFADIVAALESIEATSVGPLSAEEKAMLAARAEGRPEGRMLAPLIAALEDADPTVGGEIEPPAPSPDAAAAGSVDDFLAQIGIVAPEAAASATKAFSGALDALGPEAGLVRPLLEARPPQAGEYGGEPLGEARTRMAEAADRFEEAFRTGRRVSPEPLAPVEPLRPEASAYLGQAVVRCVAAGGSFAGRDWAGAALAGVSFAGLDLNGAMFERADLTGADFRGATLEEAVFTGAVLEGADFSNCSMRAANLSAVRAEGARFARADLTDARLMEARLAGANLSGVTLENSIALNADLTRADLTGARLCKAIFLTATLDGAILDRAEFVRCIFLQTAMNRLSARGTLFSRSALVDCEQRDGDFTGADFTDSGSLGGAVYDGSVMRDLVGLRSGWHAASMVGVDLRAAQLDGADLGKANLSGARLTRASMRRAILVETVLTGADATAATFMEALIRRADFRGGSLRHADLYRAAVEESDLTDCDLTGANLFGTSLARAVDVAR